MLKLVRAAAKLQTQLDELGLANCIIGGLAAQTWGEPRLTVDADFTVLTEFVEEEEKARRILALLSPRRPDALPFALRERVILGYTAGDIKVDIGMGGFEYERDLVSRAREVEYLPGTSLRICGPEDLIIMKVFAGRPQDWLDVKGIIIRQGSKLDWNLIEGVLPGLLELAEAPDRLDQLLALRAEEGG